MPTRQVTDWQGVVQRLERLERKARWWKGLASVLLALTGALCLLGAAGGKVIQVFDEVRARQFVLVDAKGTARAGLRVGADGSTALVLTDPDGRMLAGLAVLSEGTPRLLFYDKAGKARGGLGIQQDGTISLALADKDGTLHYWSGETALYQINLSGGQKVWRPITTLTSGSASPEDYRPADAELLPRTDGKPR